MINIHRNSGLTLVELMISVTVASLISIGVVSLYASQSSVFVNESHSTQARTDGRDVYIVISRLLRQAESSSIVVSSDAASTTIDLTLPSGYPVWPNTTFPFTNNAVRLAWTNTGDNAYQIRIATGSSIANLGAAQLTTLVGNKTGDNTWITALSLNQSAGGYLLSVSSASGNIANAVNTTFDGIVIPRN